MKSGSKVFKTLRLAFLMVLLGAAALLFLWSRNVDPRFYWFLETKLGSRLERLLGWGGGAKAAPFDKPESEFTQEEREIKRAIEVRAAAEMPSHELTLLSGQTLRGSLVSESADAVVFREQYGSSGEMAMTIRRDRVAQVAILEQTPPSVHYRDIAFQLEFPKFTLYRRPPFTVVTDESFFRVQNSVRLLERMHKDFLYLFEPLVRHPERGDSIQVLFFSDEKAYLRYQQKHAPSLESSSGFYSPSMDRLVIFNQVSSVQLKEARERLEMQDRISRAHAASDAELEQIGNRRREIERNMEHYAETQTQFTLRHEGSHQLFVTYGIHSSHQAENTWLLEGLAVFCESSRVGLREPDRVSTVKAHARAGTLIPFAELLASRSPRGLFVFGNAERVNLAYAQSWSIVHFLMQPQYREAFFEFMRFVRAPENVQAVAVRPQVELLASHLGMKPDGLEKLWREYVDERL